MFGEVKLQQELPGEGSLDVRFGEHYADPTRLCS